MYTQCWYNSQNDNAAPVMDSLRGNNISISLQLGKKSACLKAHENDIGWTRESIVPWSGHSIAVPKQIIILHFKFI